MITKIMLAKMLRSVLNDCVYASGKSFDADKRYERTKDKAEELIYVFRKESRKRK